MRRGVKRGVLDGWIESLNGLNDFYFLLSTLFPPIVLDFWAGRKYTGQKMCNIEDRIGRED